jgi:hypothetical protein
MNMRADHTRIAGMTEQLGEQRQATAVLGRLLERGADEDLPVIGWEIAMTGAGLVGRCEHPDRTNQRRADFTAWRRALDTWAGRSVDVENDDNSQFGATTRLAAAWGEYEGVSITLIADIYAEL